MKHRGLLAGISALAAGGLLLSFSVILLRWHFQVLKDVREYALPLAAEIPPLERQAALLNRQMELGALEADLDGNSAEEKLRVYVLPKEEDLTRLLAYFESARTFLENRKLLQSMSAIEIGDLRDSDTAKEKDLSHGPLRERTLHMSIVLRPEGRQQLLSILELSGLLTVGDVLSREDIRTLFELTESQNYAGIVPVKQFLSSDLLAYVVDPTAPEARLKQAMSSEEFLSAFQSLLKRSGLSRIQEILTSDLGRMLAVQKLWPIQFLMVGKESVEELADGWEEVDLTMNVYSRE